MAKKFCIEKVASASNDKDHLKECEDHLSEYLLKEVEKQVQESLRENEPDSDSDRDSRKHPDGPSRWVTVFVHVSENHESRHKLSFWFPQDEPNIVANRFCADQASFLKEHSISSRDCVYNVVEQVEVAKQNEIDKIIKIATTLQGDASKVNFNDKISLTLNIGGTNFDFLVNAMLTDNEADDVAKDFCVEHAETFGLSNSNLKDFCVTPIASQLLAAVEQRASESSE